MDLSPLAERIATTLATWLGVSPSEVVLGLRTVFVGCLCNVICGLLGCYLVLRRMSLLGDAVSHAILPGLAIAFFVSGSIAFPPMFVGALVFGVLTAFLTQTLSRYGNVTEDAGMGVVFSSLFALGVVLISNVGRMHLDKDCVFEGKIDLVAIDTTPLWGLQVPFVVRSLLPVFLLTLVFIALFWKELKVTAFDPLLATAMGINATLMHYLLMGMVAATTVASFEAVGSILVVAMLIVPGATAHLLTERLSWMMLWAAVVGVVAAVGGYLAAERWNTTVAGMMAVVVGLQFAAAVFLAPRHGLLSKAVSRTRLSLRIVAEDVLAMLYRLEEGRAESELPAAVSFSQCRQATRSRLVYPGLAWLWLAGRIQLLGGGRLGLTGAGRSAGHALVRSHRLWEAYLDEHFELPADHLHEPAERVEHYIGPELQSRLARELKDREVDPHGRSIPPSETP